MNWGNKIFISLGVFMLGIILTGIYMVSRDSDSLEDMDYYEQGLNYNQIYDKKINAIDQHAKPSLKVDRDTLYIKFVKPENKGKLLFKRPSDRSKDLELPFETRANVYQLPLSSFKKGAWKLEIIWSNGGMEFLTDHQVHL
ncbi:FixH family protein [Sphingobacterium sp. SG20118]|uniref:FixH family protein n=1 Tax=Sphingobacterium TaxID=28453 RepID=UPI0004F78688|nr:MULTISPECIES: FixH family protein [Sphingobacterium]AIM36200.1 hypothetical protein KO02_05450 [Sphingobacterium sp. ML3W]MDH5827674.1 FixH family protein [Sphingobacterium faecium]